jgi:tRNA-specific 2-thiouridylase
MNSLGINKPASETLVVAALSGGVDSSVTAALLVEEGYRVIGVTLQLYDSADQGKALRSCCGSRDIADARKVCEQLKIRHHVLNYEKKFRHDVIDDFVDSYVQGETPIPCVRCNQTVKFRDLFKIAKELGADALATGHYAQRVMGQNGPELHKAADAGRDQSYFLFSTTKEQLEFLRFPIGGMKKTTTRGLARKFNLLVSEKPDSQDICFVPSGDYASFVRKLSPHPIKKGKIIHIDGTVLGEHEGIIHYTVGQRRGIGVGASGPKEEPLYVIRLDEVKNEVIVGSLSALKKDHLRIKELNWLGPGKTIPQEGITADVKLRSTQQAVSAKIVADENKADVFLDLPEPGVARGQACVFYRGNCMLGGGWITH